MAIDMGIIPIQKIVNQPLTRCMRTGSPCTCVSATARAQRQRPPRRALSSRCATRRQWPLRASAALS